MKKEKVEHEYEEAPSGYIWLINAKEPLMKYEEGYGYQGVLALDGNDDKVQCHLCGEWFGALSTHIQLHHKMLAVEYKELVGLNKQTALISESHRDKLVRSGMNQRLQNLRSRRGAKHTEEAKKKIGEANKRHSMENKNRTNTCPEQLIDRLLKRAAELGRTPTTRELPFYEALFRTYGSYEETCRVAGLPVRKTGQTVKQGKLSKTLYKESDYIDFVGAFIEEHNREPRPKDFVAAGLADLYKHMVHYRKNKRADLVKKAMLQKGKYTKLKLISANKFNFTKKELIDFLVAFKDHHGRRPSYSDAKRGLLPHLSRYTYHFGSWKEALKEAGVK